MAKFNRIEFVSLDPDEDGLHDSGYRLLKVTGITIEEQATHRDVIETQLNTHADHIVIEGGVNIDVEPDGTIRIMPWYGYGPRLQVDTRFMGSDIEIKNEPLACRLQAK